MLLDLPTPLPQQPSPLLPLPWLKRAGLRLVVLALGLGLLLCLTLGGCSQVPQPPRSVLLQALALQIHLTQGQVAQALNLDPAGLPEVSRVRVEQQQGLRIGPAPGLKVTGRFDWRLPGDPIRVDSPFELYLQRGEQAKSWRLARPLDSPEASASEGIASEGIGQAWITDPLPLS